MIARNFETFIQITGKYICESQNWSTMFLLVSPSRHFSHGSSHHPQGLRKLLILLQATFFKYLFPPADKAWGGTRQRIHVGMDEMYEIVDQVTYRFFGIDELYKLVMDEMYQIGWFIAKFEYAYSRICVTSVVGA